MVEIRGVMVTEAEDWARRTQEPAWWATRVEAYVAATEARMDEALSCGCSNRWVVAVRGPVQDVGTGDQVIWWTARESFGETGEVPIAEVGRIVREGVRSALERTHEPS